MASNLTTQVLLVLGAGQGIGRSVANAFAAKGYKIALVGRSLKPENSTASELHIQADFTDTSYIPKIFAQVQEVFGPPGVIVYNAASRTLNDLSNPLALDQTQILKDFAVNTFSVLIAAELAVKGFDILPKSASKTFIFTGNYLNETPRKEVIGFSLTKAATANLIHAASEAYKEKGYKFYYADERKADGNSPFLDISGEAAAKFYVQLAEEKTQGPWQATHVKGKGYVKFPRRERANE